MKFEIRSQMRPIYQNEYVKQTISQCQGTFAPALHAVKGLNNSSGQDRITKHVEVESYGSGFWMDYLRGKKIMKTKQHALIVP